MSWPVCQTPPRVVTQSICVEKPNSADSHSLSETRFTPTRPSSHQHIPTPAPARIALIPDSRWSAVTGPIKATSGSNAIAGNGANGTSTGRRSDHVVRAERHREPGAPVQEGVCEIEEVAPTGIEKAIAQPVDDRRHCRDAETDPHPGTHAY